MRDILRSMRERISVLVGAMGIPHDLHGRGPLEIGVPDGDFRRLPDPGQGRRIAPGKLIRDAFRSEYQNGSAPPEASYSGPTDSDYREKP